MTICHHREYIGAVLSYHNGRCRVIEEFLGDAAPLLWRSHPQTWASESQRKDRFMALYNRHCQPMLSNVILEWFHIYNCNEAYQDFYALKLLEVANLFMFGERAQGDLRHAIQKKPDAKIHFLYDSDAWEELGD